MIRIAYAASDGMSTTTYLILKLVNRTAEKMKETLNRSTEVALMRDANDRIRGIVSNLHKIPAVKGGFSRDHKARVNRGISTPKK